MSTPPARTMFDRIWKSHVVTHEESSPAVLYIDPAPISFTR